MSLKQFLQEFLSVSSELQLECEQLAVKNRELKWRIDYLKSINRDGRVSSEIAILEGQLKAAQEVEAEMREALKEGFNDVFA